MKKIALVTLLILSVLATCLVGCKSDGGNGDGNNNNNNQPVAPTTYYSVTFKQEGFQDVVRTVESGKALPSSNIPNPRAVAGHTVTWEQVDLSSVTKDVTVNAIITANEYTITLLYEADNLPVDVTALAESVKVVYGQVAELPAFESNGYEIVGWLYEDGTEYAGGAYKDTTNITLKAKWEYHTPPIQW